jgi:hypothetical protein
MMWCQKIPEKWSPCSPHVARGSKVRMREEREEHGRVGCLSFSLNFLDLF